MVYEEVWWRVQWAMMRNKYSDLLDMFDSYTVLGTGALIGIGRESEWRSRLSKWKAKTLSIGGRLTLLKSVLGAAPVYTMSIYKVPKGVLKVMESIRSNFFKGVEFGDKKVSWVAWDKVLASKKKGGLGVSSFLALNRALILKWVWRFVSQDGSLWFRVIQALYGVSIDRHSSLKTSVWSSILKEVRVLKDKGFDFLSFCSKRIGDGNTTRFWLDIWKGDKVFRDIYPRVFSLVSNPNITVAEVMGVSLGESLRRPVRGGAEEQQFAELALVLDSVVCSSLHDRWVCTMSSDGNFRVKDVRISIDEIFLPSHTESTSWVRYVPNKVNIFAWRARRDCLPTRVNLINRGVTLESSSCPMCRSSVEDVHHVLLRCSLAQAVLRRVCRWWDLDWQPWLSFSDWSSWFESIRLPAGLNCVLEGVFFVSWWSIWGLRNRIIFSSSSSNRSVIFDDIVSLSFLWCKNRCNRSFSWDEWLKNPHLILM
ncbi:RNA-directed DNA polymerase, eukaryota [Tanacetum coccineum]